LLTSREEAIPVPVVPHDRRGGAVPGAVAQQPGAAVRGVEQPLLDGVVGGRAHEAGLPRKEVEGKQGGVVGIPVHTLVGRMLLRENPQKGKEGHSMYVSAQRRAQISREQESCLDITGFRVYSTLSK